MQNPFFWLLLSFLLVAISLTAVLAAAFPAFIELGRTARSAEKLFDTLNRELPRTLEALRNTGGELATLGDELEESLKGANKIIKQTENSLQTTQQHLQTAQRHSRSIWVGLKATWQVMQKQKQKQKTRRPSLKSKLPQHPKNHHTKNR